MGFKFGGGRAAQDPGQIVEHGGHGGMFATVLSGVALLFSGLSYYESSLKTADLAVFVPPMIHYARDGDNDVFNVPITIANDGARTGTVLNMVLEVENLRPDAERKTARFHSAFLGEYPHSDDAINRSFAPLSISGHGTFTETVRFYPMDEALPFLVDDKGDYRFTLKLQTARAVHPDFAQSWLSTEPQPLTFELNLPYIAFQHLAFRHGTIAMYNKDWKPAVSTSSDPAVSRKMPDPENKSGDGKKMAPLPKAEIEPAPEAQPQSAPEAAPQSAPEVAPEAPPAPQPTP